MAVYAAAALVGGFMLGWMAKRGNSELQEKDKSAEAEQDLPDYALELKKTKECFKSAMIQGQIQAYIPYLKKVEAPTEYGMYAGRADTGDLSFEKDPVLCTINDARLLNPAPKLTDRGFMSVNSPT